MYLRLSCAGLRSSSTGPSPSHLPIIPSCCARPILKVYSSSQKTWLLKFLQFQLRGGASKSSLSISTVRGVSWGWIFLIIFKLKFSPRVPIFSFPCTYYSSYFTHQDLKDSVIQSVDAVKTVKQSIFSLVTSIPKVTWIQEVFFTPVYYLNRWKCQPTFP